MKLHTVKKGLYTSLGLLLLTNTAYAGYPGVMGPTAFASPSRFYLGIFGGWAWTRSFDISQYGTAYYFEAAGGPLAVNAFGDTNSRSDWLLGGQVGIQVPQVIIDTRYQWGIGPAFEMEAFYLGKRTFSGHIVNDETTRLVEHDFHVSFPIRRRVFLANVVANLNIPCLLFHPYVGAGFGAALVRISSAHANQVSPPEPGINHYNTNTGDTDPTFAGQIKVGLSYDITNCLNVFAEYRWLYLSSTHFAFGSTDYPGHPVTSHWQVNLDPHYTNIGTIGIRLNL